MLPAMMFKCCFPASSEAYSRQPTVRSQRTNEHCINGRINLDLGTDRMSFHTPFCKVFNLIDVSSLVSSEEVVYIPAGHDKTLKRSFRPILSIQFIPPKWRLMGVAAQECFGTFTATISTMGSIVCFQVAKHLAAPSTVSSFYNKLKSEIIQNANRHEAQFHPWTYR